MNNKIATLIKSTIQNNLNIEISDIDIESLVNTLDRIYSDRFFRTFWKPRTNEYSRSGEGLIDEINRLNPKAVLDVGCGYHPFKGKIQNLLGIDPFNTNADYCIDILDFRAESESYDCIIALGSINFNDKEHIEQQFKHCVDMLKVNGRFYLRTNPGINHVQGPYIDIFPWNAEIVNEFAMTYNLELLEFAEEANGRLFFIYRKLPVQPKK